MSRKAKYTYKLAEWGKEEIEKVIASKICSKENRLRVYIILKSADNNEGVRRKSSCKGNKSKNKTRWGVFYKRFGR